MNTNVPIRSRRSAIHETIQWYLLAGVVITLPFFLNINSYLIVLLFLNWLISGGYESKWQQLKRNRFVFFFLLFFAVFVLSLLYSSNVDLGVTKITHKLSLLVFPLVIGSAGIPRKWLKRILLSFATATVAATLICLGVAIVHWIQTGETEQFFYHSLAGSVNISAVYLAAYSTFSLLVLFYYWYRREFSKTVNLLLFITGVYLLLCTVLLSSRVFIVMATMIALMFIILKIRQHSSLFAGLSLGVLVLAIVALLVVILPNLNERFEDLAGNNLEIAKQSEFRYDTPFTGLSLRLVLWRLSVNVLNEEDAWITGVGTGDARELMNRQYAQHNMYLGNPRLGDTGYLNYNTHSQYFQVLLELGIIGLVMWLVCLLYPLAVTAARGEWLAFLFFIMVALFGITEVYLSTQKGVVFFALFSCLLFSKSSATPTPRS